MIKQLSPTLLLALLTACQSDLTLLDTQPSAEALTLDLTASIPAPRRAATRSQIGEPGRIDGGMTVAVYGSGGALIETAEAIPYTDGQAGQPGGPLTPSQDGLYHYRVTLHGTDGETRLHFIAGTHDQDVRPGTEGSVIGNMTTSAQPTADGNYTYPDAYWQRVVLPRGIQADDISALRTALSGIQLVRGSVKITLTSVAEGFTLEGYELVRVPLRTHTALYHDGQFIALTPAYTQAQMESIYQGGGWPNPGYDEKLLTDQTADQGRDITVRYDANAYKSTDAKYMYQRAIVSRTAPTYLIAKGTYQGQTGYYKINLTGADGNLTPLFRNFEYAYTITAVTAPGSATPYEASQTAGTGDLTILSVTHYDNTLTGDAGTLRLGWTETTYNLDDYQSEQTLLLPTQFFPASGTTVDNAYLWVEDEQGRLICAGMNDGTNLSGKTVATPGSGDAAGEVFDHVDIRGQNIALHLKQPPTTGSRHQRFLVAFQDGTNVKHQMVTIHSIGALQLGILAVNDQAGTPQYNTATVPTGVGRPVAVYVHLPQGLPTSLFPIPLNLFVSNQSLSPKAGEALSVGLSEVREGQGTGLGGQYSATGTFYFKHVLAKDEYDRLTLNQDNKKEIAFRFTTSKVNSGSYVYVSTDKITTAKTEFVNPATQGQFTNLHYTNLLEAGRADPLTLQFTTSSITTPHVTLSPGLEPANEYMTLVSRNADGSREYNVYSVTAGTHSIVLRATADYDGTSPLTATLTATNYDAASVTLHPVSLPDRSVTITCGRSNTGTYTQDGITVTSSKGSVGNDGAEISRYDGLLTSRNETLTVSSSAGPMQTIELTMNGNPLGLAASTGTMNATTWTGHARSVTFSAARSSMSQYNYVQSLTVSLPAHVGFEQQ